MSNVEMMMKGKLTRNGENVTFVTKEFESLMEVVGEIQEKCDSLTITLHALQEHFGLDIEDIEKIIDEYIEKNESNPNEVLH